MIPNPLCTLSAPTVENDLKVLSTVRREIQSGRHAKNYNSLIIPKTSPNPLKPQPKPRNLPGYNPTATTMEEEKMDGDTQSEKYQDFREFIRKPATQMASEKVASTVATFLPEDSDDLQKIGVRTKEVYISSNPTLSIFSLT